MGASPRSEVKHNLRVVSETTSEPQPGAVVAGRYTLRRLIARGGVGDIYLASQTDGEGKERTVVLKLLADRWMKDQDAIARFEREATRMHSLEHPNVVTLYDSGVDLGRPFLAMEHIDGEPLSDYIARRGPLPMKEFVPIAAQILKGIGHAHSREMMIRDIKPSNIMLCERKGRANFVKILDFGLAKFTRDEAPLTEGYVLGTAGYLAPEAIKGQSLTLRVDVYSIGVLFYHLLSGHLPFEGDEGATIFYKTINERPESLVTRLPEGHDVPDELIALIADCLEKDPERRPADANMIVERLIDAVPASYFRLPRMHGTGETAMPGNTTGFGNTGLLELVRENRNAQNAGSGTKAVPEAPARKRSLREWVAIATVACLASAATAIIVQESAFSNAAGVREARASIVGQGSAASAVKGGVAEASARVVAFDWTARSGDHEQLRWLAPIELEAPAAAGLSDVSAAPIETISPRRNEPARRLARASQTTREAGSPATISAAVAAPAPALEPEAEVRPVAAPGPSTDESRRASVFLSAERPADQISESRPLLLPAR